MGFFSPGNNGNHYIGIRIKGLPQKTLVWVANRNRLVSGPFSLELKLLGDRNLVILASSKGQIWSTGSTSLMPNSTSRVLLDDGNFIFRKTSNVSSVAWQSFDHPTDTWLPDDPAPGIFSVIPEAEEKFQFSLFNRSEAYWCGVDWTSDNYGLQPSLTVENAITFTYVSNENENSKYSSVAPYNLSRIVLEPTGLLKELVWAKRIQEWKVLLTEPTLESSEAGRSSGPMQVEKCVKIAYAYTANCLIWTDDKFVVQLSADDAISRDFYVRIMALDLKEETHLFRKGSNTLDWKTRYGISFLLVLSVSLVTIGRRRSASAADDHLMHFAYRVLKKATKNFSEKIGEGGFSSVFRGALPDSTPIAVKKLVNQNQSNKQFLAELICFRKFAAPSIGKADTASPWGLLKDWSISMGGVAIASYTATSSQTENILLDSELVPQIADFGLVKLLGWDVSCIITAMRGTRGYLAPEWILGGAITSKVDVFSYRKVLFEIISGNRNIEELNSDMRDYLPIQVANSIAKGEEVLPLVDRS
ncbi:hypothetical protein NL676_000980 [Syzygium grande]|nr:hypothetical protein NL676_000980 [Syzygium grande]